MYGVGARVYVEDVVGGFLWSMFRKGMVAVYFHLHVHSEHNIVMDTI
jgi:hypothetical protein